MHVSTKSGYLSLELIKVSNFMETTSNPHQQLLQHSISLCVALDLHICNKDSQLWQVSCHMAACKSTISLLVTLSYNPSIAQMQICSLYSQQFKNTQILMQIDKNLMEEGFYYRFLSLSLV